MKKILPTGTANTKKKRKTLKKPCACAEKENNLQTFPLNDICGIIDTCSKSGVSEFSYGELHISFGGSKPEPTIDSYDKEFEEVPTEIGDDEISPASKEILEEYHETQQIIEDHAAFEDAQIDRLMNGNPNGQEADY